MLCPIIKPKCPIFRQKLSYNPIFFSWKVHGHPVLGCVKNFFSGLTLVWSGVIRHGYDARTHETKAEAKALAMLEAEAEA